MDNLECCWLCKMADNFCQRANKDLLENREKKAALVEALTATASSITQIPADKFIIFINEMERDDIGIGGRLLSDILK